MFCNNCGSLVVEGNAFCTGCGRRVEGPAAPVPGKRGPVVPIVIAVLLVAGAGAGFMLWRSSGMSSSAPKSTVARSTSVTAPAGLRVETVDGKGWGVHSVKRYYDSAGNPTRVECYGVDGRLTLSSDGWAIFEVEYDSAGNPTRLAYYGVDGRLTLSSDGIAISEAEFDSAGNIIREEVYGVDGRLTLHKNGYAIGEFEYDSAGNMTRGAYYGVDGRLTLHKDGYAIIEYEYDSAGKETRQRGYDANGRLVN